MRSVSLEKELINKNNYVKELDDIIVKKEATISEFKVQPKSGIDCFSIIILHVLSVQLYDRAKDNELTKIMEDRDHLMSYYEAKIKQQQWEG